MTAANNDNAQSAASPNPGETCPRRVYALDPAQLTAEQIAVTFAMTSRRPESFDRIARQVSAEQAADFHERWVVGYGHASVAEHAALHLAVENISRLAADALEDNRLASYTEKSSRYQVLPQEGFHTPEELDQDPAARQEYIKTAAGMMAAYHQILEKLTTALRRDRSRREKESESAYAGRLTRQAADAARALLPAAALTNVGVTMNARALEHAVAKLLSSGCRETENLGLELRTEARRLAPTLVKYAAASPYLARRSPTPAATAALPPEAEPETTDPPPAVRLLEADPNAEARIAAALQFRQEDPNRATAREQERQDLPEDREVQAIQEIIDQALAEISPHEAPPREFELAEYTFLLTMDYGASREYRRHRMQTVIAPPLTVDHGWRLPPLIEQYGLAAEYNAAMTQATAAAQSLARSHPTAARYLTAHGHWQTLLVRINARGCWQLFRLRVSPQAHEAIREPAEAMLKLAVERHPGLFRRLPLRRYPDWWPFPD